AFPVGQADLVVRGQTAQFLRVMDRPPLGIASRLGLPPADVAGRAAWRLRVGFPVGPARPGSETRVIAAANLSGLSLPNIGGGLPLDDGSFHMIVSNDGMRLEGQGLVAGIPAEVGVRQSFVRGAPVPRQTRLRAVLDDAGRAALGLPGGDLLRGVVGIDATLSERAAAPTAALVSLDLSSATFDVPPLGWRKPPDMPAEARLTFDLTAVADGPPAIAAIDTIRLVAGDPAAGGMLATGAVTLAPDGAVDSLTLRELRVGQTDARGQMRLAADGVWLIDVEGNSLDVGGLLNTGDDDQAATAAATTADDRPATVPPMRLSVRVSSLWLGPGQLVDQALLAADHDGVRLARLDLSGQVGRGAPLLVQLTPVAGGRALRVHSDDAGAALRALGLFDRVFGGRMEVRAAYDDSQDPALMTGRLQMVDFRTVSDPVVARIAALMEIDAAEEFLVGEIGFTFASLIVPFTRLGDIITISEGRAVGAQLGLSADGTIDLSADTLDIEGTAAPIYAINSVVGRIPILGPLIAGGQDEGLFAATYTARGSLAEPDVSVNVLSVFTPGLLRNIFGIFTGDPSTVDVPPLDADNRR
ncbi:MAG: AsmA-like C-terminal domain-containing protein, partial [Alphaproteobacteria bacterium]